MNLKSRFTESVNRKSNWNLVQSMICCSIATLLSGGIVSSAFSQSPSDDDQYLKLQKKAAEFQSPFNVVRDIVKTIEPTVVHIEAKKTQHTVSTDTKKSNASAIIEEAGSGVVFKYRDRFFIITNYHVIEDSEPQNIRVEANGRVFYPTRAVHDPATDLSVLFTNKSDLVAARIGDSDAIEIGDFVVVVGSPFGLSHSVSYGIISAKGRRDLELGPHGVRFQDFFQTDAAINPGNSGGPLINLRGEVIGINTAIASNSGGNDGIGFSIPISMVMRIAKDLVDYGTVHRGFLGVSLDARYTPEKGQIIGLELAYGTRVSGITPGSPAALADFQIGDIVVEFGSVKIASDSHLVTEVSLTEIGTDVPVKVFRAGKFKTIYVNIQDRNKFTPAK